MLTDLFLHIFDPLTRKVTGTVRLDDPSPYLLAFVDQITAPAGFGLLLSTMADPLEAAEWVLSYNAHMTVQICVN